MTSTVAWSFDDLVASHLTLTGAPRGSRPRFPLVHRIAAAARAGFSGIGLRIDDYLAERADGLSADTLVGALRDHGVRALELEALYGWCHDDDRAVASRRAEEQMYDLADLVGIRHLTVCDVDEPTEDIPLQLAAERFAAVCDRAAGHGVLVGLEFLPWSRFDTPGAAAEVVRLAGRANGGLVVDAWHFFRGPAGLSELASIAATDIVAVQLDDGPAEREGSWLEDTTRRRLLPGTGSFDLVGFLRVLEAGGVRTPLAVEVLSDELYRLPLEEVARASHDAARSVLEDSRGEEAQ